MEKAEILKKYNEEEKLLISKVLDKIEFAKTKNKIQNSDFMNLAQQTLIEKILKRLNIKNYIWSGGIEEAERKVLILYPEKLDEIFKENKYNKNEVIKVCRITLPNELKNKYSHKDYLGGFMKIGIKREKIGDIIFDENGADVMILEEVEKYFENSIKELVRFKKAQIEKINIEDIREVKENVEELSITVPSMRMDAIISELAKTSRNKANEIINSQRVFVNQINETKLTKEIKVGDKITIRGKGKFEILNQERETRNGRKIIKIKHWK